MTGTTCAFSVKAGRLVVNQRLAGIAKDNGAISLERIDFMCSVDEARCFAVADDLSKHFYDEHHTTMTGAAFFGQRISEIGWLDPVLHALERRPYVLRKDSENRSVVGPEGLEPPTKAL